MEVHSSSSHERIASVQIADLLTANDIAFGIRGKDIGDAAAQLLQQTLPRRGFAPADITRLVNAVIARERETPTLCGPIAIPHARDSQLKSFIAAVGINRDGIADSPTPRIVIAFLSPDAQRTEHLALLSSLARLSRDQAAIEAMATASTPEEVLKVVRQHLLQR